MQVRQGITVASARGRIGYFQSAIGGRRRKRTEAFRHDPGSDERYSGGGDHHTLWNRESGNVIRVLRARKSTISGNASPNREADTEGGVVDAVSDKQASVEPAVETPAVDKFALASRRPDARTAALCVIAVILVLFALRTAAAFFIPLLLSLFLNYALAPAVTKMARFGIPRYVGAALVVGILVALLAGAFYRVSNDVTTVLEQMPSAVQRLRLALTETQREHTGALEHVQRAATEIEKLADAAAPATTATPAAVAPRTTAPAPAPEKMIDVRSALLVGTGNVTIALGQLMSALFLTFFLLAAGDMFRRKIISAVGPSLALRKTTLRILDDIDRLNQHYFAVVLVVNIAIGIVTGLALFAIGLEHPVVWGTAAAILHTIPYLGSAVIACAAALMAYGQFGTVQAALLAGSVPILAAAVLGMVMQTWLMGRAARMNAPAVFISLLFWGMVWGGWGLLLAVPVMVAIKTVCDNFVRLKPIGALLGP
jgi:predicted PurR-regulated permease PerM